MRGMRRRYVVTATVGVALLGVLAAVLALMGDRGGASTAGSPTVAPEVGVAEPAPGGAAGTSGDDARSAAGPAPGALPDPIGRDVVRTAQLTLQVPDPTAAARGVRTAVATAGGVVAEEQVDGTGAWLVVRVPAAGLDRLVDDLAATGVVLGRSGRAEDATEQVVDLDSRVATQQASVTRVRALLAQATSIGDVVAVESELARREADLDSLQRRLATLKDRVALSTLTVELRSAPAPAPVTPRARLRCRAGCRVGRAEGDRVGSGDGGRLPAPVPAAAGDRRGRGVGGAPSAREGEAGRPGSGGGSLTPGHPVVLRPSAAESGASRGRPARPRGDRGHLGCGGHPAFAEAATMA